MLAMVVNEDAYLLSKCGALKTIASKPAPTEAEIVYRGLGQPLTAIVRRVNQDLVAMLFT